MPRGGKRAGAGRKRGSVNRKAQVAAALIAGEGPKPLDVALGVMRHYAGVGAFDKAADLAVKLAPYFHQRFSPTDQPAEPHPEQGLLPLFGGDRAAREAPLGKKEQAMAAAANAGRDTDWGDLLHPDAERPN